MLERADQGVGRVLDLLDRLKLAPNTIVVFTSDNGGEWLSRNAPLFHRKSTLWEGGIRVPLLVRWPGHLKPRTASRQVGLTMDLTASFLAAAGAHPPDSYRPEGIDLIGLLKKGTVVERTIFWRLIGSTQRAARRGPWKTLRIAASIFCSISKDPGERHDLAQAQTVLMRELRVLVAKWEADVDAEAKQRAAPSTQRGSDPPSIH